MSVPLLVFCSLSYPLVVCGVLYARYKQFRCLVKGVPYDRADMLVREGQLAQNAQEREFSNSVEDECSICYQSMGSQKVLFQCSHAYCAQCVVQYLATKPRRQVACPFCRADVDFIILQNSEAIEPALLDKLSTYNTMHSQVRQTFGDLLLDIPTWVRVCERELRAVGLTVVKFAIGCAVAFYF